MDNQKLMEFQKGWVSNKLIAHFTVRDQEKHKIFQEASLVNPEDNKMLETKCTYCHGLVYDPMECDECNTPYCKRCIYVDEDQIENKGAWACPKKCSSKKYKKLNRYLQALIKQLKVVCNRCNEEMYFDNLGKDEHLEACFNRSMPCPLNCKKILKSIKDGQEHLQSECPEAYTTCPRCQSAEPFVRKNKEEHDQKCPEAMVNCSNSEVFVKRKELQSTKHDCMSNLKQ